jgi:hypothetical protein
MTMAANLIRLEELLDERVREIDGLRHELATRWRAHAFAAVW